MAFGRNKEKTFPVMTTYPEYSALKERWEVCREVIAGEDVVKQRGEKYLPMATHKCQDIQKARYNAYTFYSVHLYGLSGSARYGFQTYTYSCMF